MASSATRRRFSRGPVMRPLSRGIERHPGRPPAGDLDARHARRRRRGLRRRLARGRVRERDDHGAPGELAAARDEGHGPVVHGELAGLLGAPLLCVAHVVQPRHELALANHLAGVEGEWPGEYAGDYPVAFAVQARFDDPRELDVVIAERGGQNDGGGRQGEDERLQQAVPPQELHRALRAAANAFEGPSSSGHGRVPVLRCSARGAGPCRAGARRRDGAPARGRSG